MSRCPAVSMSLSQMPRCILDPVASHRYCPSKKPVQVSTALQVPAFCIASRDSREDETARKAVLFFCCGLVKACNLQWLELPHQRRPRLVSSRIPRPHQSRYRTHLLATSAALGNQIAGSGAQLDLALCVLFLDLVTGTLLRSASQLDSLPSSAGPSHNSRRNSCLSSLDAPAARRLRCSSRPQIKGGHYYHLEQLNMRRTVVPQ